MEAQSLDDTDKHTLISVRGDFVTSRFTDEEMRRIFERAAEAGVHPQSSSRADGHTIEEIHAIAREVGIDRAAVDRAAADIVSSRSSGAATPGRFRFTRLVHEDGSVERALSNEEMRSAVSQVEQIMGRRGMLSVAGPWVEWRDSKGRLYLGMVRGEQRTHLRAIADYSGEVITGAIAIAVVGSLLLTPAEQLGGVGVAAVIAGTFSAIALFWRWRSKIARGYLRELIDLIQDSAR